MLQVLCKTFSRFKNKNNNGIDCKVYILQLTVTIYSREFYALGQIVRFRVINLLMTIGRCCEMNIFFHGDLFPCQSPFFRIYEPGCHTNCVQRDIIWPSYYCLQGRKICVQKALPINNNLDLYQSLQDENFVTKNNNQKLLYFKGHILFLINYTFGGFCGVCGVPTRGNKKCVQNLCTLYNSGTLEKAKALDYSINIGFMVMGFEDV